MLYCELVYDLLFTLASEVLIAGFSLGGFYIIS